MTIHKDKVDQARTDMLKTIRTLVRLKYSLLADAELNDVLPQAQAVFDAATHRQRLLSVNEVRKAIGL